VAERLAMSDDRIVVNVQGDEPLMPPALIQQVAGNLAKHSQASMSTLCARITSAEELFNSNAVKVVMDAAGMALYFSRAPIPWDRDAFAKSKEELPACSTHYRHIGLYAYRAGFLRQYVQWPPCPLEETESLEQLRALWHGKKIHVAVAVEPPPPGVDTQQDLELVRRHFTA
jgi:3-deoxy-manno-octulosonate cytidylyltransferase (CMP-KDO synthetase)